jgi:hypothetical protein
MPPGPGGGPLGGGPRPDALPGGGPLGGELPGGKPEGAPRGGGPLGGGPNKKINTILYT